ncbi:MAG: acetyltransferase [Chloroflexota bacterium]
MNEDKGSLPGRSILIIGAGGHAKVVADILLCSGLVVMGFVDDNPAIWGEQRLGLPVLGAIDTYASYEAGGLVMGIGDNENRMQVVERLGQPAGKLWRQAIHPRAILAASVVVGRGVVVVAGAVVNPDTVLGDHVIVNTGATIDHDCEIGDYAHIAPGVHISGGVHVGTAALIGVGASVAPGRSIGVRAIVGAGAAVVHDLPDGVTAKGVPARYQR